MAVLFMSKLEFSRLDVLLRVQSGRLRIADAYESIGLHRRQVFRLLRGLKQDGAPSLLSKRRGKPSNHRCCSFTLMGRHLARGVHLQDLWSICAMIKVSGRRHKTRMTLLRDKHLLRDIGITHVEAE